MNGNYQFADGATSKTFEKTASVTPAELTIKTKDVETEYGTVKTTTSEVEGLVNGDLPTGSSTTMATMAELILMATQDE